MVKGIGWPTHHNYPNSYYPKKVFLFMILNHHVGHIKEFWKKGVLCRIGGPTQSSPVWDQPDIANNEVCCASFWFCAAAQFWRDIKTIAGSSITKKKKSFVYLAQSLATITFNIYIYTYIQIWDDDVIECAGCQFETLVRRLFHWLQVCTCFKLS